MNLFTKAQKVDSFVFSHATIWPEWFKEALLAGTAVIKGSLVGLAKVTIVANGTRYIINEEDVVIRDRGVIFSLTREQIQDFYVDSKGAIPQIVLTVPRNFVTKQEVAAK